MKTLTKNSLKNFGITLLLRTNKNHALSNFAQEPRKQLFFGRQRFPTITCPICNSYEPDTWLHVLLTCKQQHIHALHVKRHNKAVWEIKKLLIPSEKSRCYTLMNAGTFNDNPQENTVPNWLLPCICGTQRCHCNSRFKPDILCVKGLPY